MFSYRGIRWNLGVFSLLLFQLDLKRTPRYINKLCLIQTIGLNRILSYLLLRWKYVFSQGKTAKAPFTIRRDHEVRTTFCKTLSNSISVVGTWSKLVKYVMLTFILHCYYVADSFSLRLTDSYKVFPTRSSHAHLAPRL